ncbi:MAG: WSD1 family O-acyltransferase, partial [Acidimicrobiia bacterium]|nr:WSD1 family O-acyltransferase [Acidimicrobiia bacterium]
LPMHADPDQQMTEIRNQMAESVNEPALSWITSLAGVLRRLPNPMSTAVFAASLRGTDVQASNVPGSRVPMYLTGSRLRVQYPFGPLASAALNVTLLSYQDELHLGIASNPGAVGDPEALIDDLEAGFTAVIG